MLKVNPTVITLGIAGILAIAVGFYVNSVSWGPIAEEKTTQATANTDAAKPAKPTTTAPPSSRPGPLRPPAASSRRAARFASLPRFPAASSTLPLASTIA